MSAAEFSKLADLFPDETVTHSYVQDIALPGGGSLHPFLGGSTLPWVLED